MAYAGFVAVTQFKSVEWNVPIFWLAAEAAVVSAASNPGCTQGEGPKDAAES